MGFCYVQPVIVIFRGVAVSKTCEKYSIGPYRQSPVVSEPETSMSIHGATARLGHAGSVYPRLASRTQNDKLRTFWGGNKKVGPGPEPERVMVRFPLRSIFQVIKGDLLIWSPIDSSAEGNIKTLF